jgi:hypothetical protein
MPAAAAKCRYARSIVSCVSTARKLQRSMVPGEQEVWRCVWERAESMDWDMYTGTALAGVQRTLLLDQSIDQCYTCSNEIYTGIHASHSPKITWFDCWPSNPRQCLGSWCTS